MPKPFNPSKRRDAAVTNGEYRRRKQKSAAPLTATALHQHAEAQLRSRQKNQHGEERFAQLKADPQRLFHELQVHQVELELQNLELLDARNRMEVLLEKYTDLYDFAPAGYLSIDESGAILEVNLTGAVILGMERSRLIKRFLQSFVSVPSRPVYLAFLKTVFAGSRSQSCELQLHKADGGACWMSFQASPAVSFKGTPKWSRLAFVDITAGVQAEALLRDSEERFRALFELGPLAIYSCDNSGVIQQFNRRAVELWGRKPALGDAGDLFCGSFKLFNPDGRGILHKQCPMAEVVAGKKREVRDAEIIIERPDGTRITAVVNIRALKNKKGEVTGAINCFYDITERKHVESARQRAEEIAVKNQKLEHEIARRLAETESFKQKERHKNQLLEQSRITQEQLRHLSRQVLKGQEEERKRISRELHDVIAQTLTGINLRLAALKMEAGLNAKDFGRNVTRTQRLVEKSVAIVHQFARELRPAVLDDLGLIPALLSFLKIFTAQTGVRTHLTAFAGVEELDSARRTTLYRIAQEALTNVARHAHASRVEVGIQLLAPGGVCMTIKDDGKSFNVASVLVANGGKRLGLLGMRERLEMVGGKFEIESAIGQGTTIIARIPFGKLAGVATKPVEIKL